MRRGGGRRGSSCLTGWRGGRRRVSGSLRITGALQVYDPREWALAGETPDSEGFRRDDWESTWDEIRCHRRYGEALRGWFAEHPGADFIEFLNMRRARRRSAP